MIDAYSVVEMGGTPEDLKAVLPEKNWSSGGWGIVRNHDDELMSVYRTREEAEAALVVE